MSTLLDQQKLVEIKAKQLKWLTISNVMIGTETIQDSFDLLCNFLAAHTAGDIICHGFSYRHGFKGNEEGSNSCERKNS